MLDNAASHSAGDYVIYALEKTTAKDSAGFFFKGRVTAQTKNPFTYISGGFLLQTVAKEPLKVGSESRYTKMGFLNTC